MKTKKLIECFNKQKADLLNEVKGGDTSYRTERFSEPDANGYIHVTYTADSEGGLSGLMGAGLASAIR